MLIQLLVIIKHFITYLFYHVFFILPVKKGQFYFDSFYGRSFSCNPKYIFLHLLKQDVINIDNCYWTKRKDVKNFDINLNKKNYCIPWNLKTIKRIMTSEYIIVNTDIPYNIPIRKTQCYINTWHGGGAYKRCGFDNPNENTLFNRFRAFLRSKQMSYLISSSEKFSAVMKTGLKLSSNIQYLKFGMPRNDILFNKEVNVKKLRDYFGLSDSDLVVLYAPTYRSKNDNFVIEEFINNLNKITCAFKSKFGKEVKYLFRAHYYYEKINCSNTIIDVTSYPDMQELLLLCDVLVTDYSSSIWDFAFLKKPCFLFCPDYSEYFNERSFYTPIETWPGYFAGSSDELIKMIDKYNYGEFERKLDFHINMLNSYEDGHACEKFEEFINSRK